MPNYIIPFIRDEGRRGITTTARLSITTLKRMSVPAILQAPTKCLTHWVKNTDEGHKAWQQSCGDFNIGDFAMYESTINQTIMHSTMKRYGLMNWTILDSGDLEPVPYDTILVDRSKLPDDWDNWLVS